MASTLSGPAQRIPVDRMDDLFADRGEDGGVAGVKMVALAVFRRGRGADTGDGSVDN